MSVLTAYAALRTPAVLSTVMCVRGFDSLHALVEEVAKSIGGCTPIRIG